MVGRLKYGQECKCHHQIDEWVWLSGKDEGLTFSFTCVHSQDAVKVLVKEYGTRPKSTQRQCQKKKQNPIETGKQKVEWFVNDWHMC